MESADKRWRDFYDRLKSAGKTEVDHQVFKDAMRPQNYKYQADFILQRFPQFKEMDVLEIGCGFGGLCHTLHQAVVPKSYTVVDNPEMLEFAREMLKNQKVVKFVKATEVEENNWSDLDLLISNYCLSETPREYQDFVLETIFPVCSNIIMLDGDKKTDYVQRLGIALRKYFNTVHTSGYKRDWRVDWWIARHNKAMVNG